MNPLATTPDPRVEIVIPVYNEQASLAQSIIRLRSFLAEHFRYDAKITIADNASTDRTREIARSLADTLDGVHLLHLDAKGRGRALRAAWGRSSADIVAYMDVDLSTDLACLESLITPLARGECEIATGSRLAEGSQVRRGLKRELISRCYNAILHRALASPISDAQCGFKAGRRESIQSLLNEVEDENWFFDTELLWCARQHGMRVHEVPVAWVDDPDSRVAIVATALEDLRGVARLRRRARVPRDQAPARRTPAAEPTGPAPAPAR